MFASDDVSVERAWEVGNNALAHQSTVECILDRHFYPKENGAFLDVFLRIAFPDYVKRKEREEEQVWLNKWDVRNAEAVLGWLEAGGDANRLSRGHCYSDGMTLYFLATYFGCPKMKQLMIERGADPTLYTWSPPGRKAATTEESA
jgi:hypothetical protein